MMVDLVKIEEIREEHISGFHNCLDTVAKEGKYLLFSQAPSIENVRQFVLENIKGNKIQFVATQINIVVGWIDILGGAFETNLHCGRLGMGILPDWRGKGIGSRLIETALKAESINRFKVIQLEVFETNTRAIQLYEKYGFEREGLRKAARYIDGNYINDVPMSKIIGDITQ